MLAFDAEDIPLWVSYSCEAFLSIKLGWSVPQCGGTIRGGEIFDEWNRPLGCSLPRAVLLVDFASKIESPFSRGIAFVFERYLDHVSGFLLEMVELGEQLLICDLGVLMLFRLLRNPLLTENVAAPFYDKIALAPSIILRDSSS